MAGVSLRESAVLAAERKSQLSCLRRGPLGHCEPSRWRPAWIGSWLAVAVAVAVAVTMAAMGSDFTDVGHALALLLGMAVSTRFGPPSSWTRLRYALLAVGAAFGYLVLASTGMLIATVAGLAGAVVAALASHRVRGHVKVPICGQL
jgi:hypothetical protein